MKSCETDSLTSKNERNPAINARASSSRWNTSPKPASGGGEQVRERGEKGKDKLKEMQEAQDKKIGKIMKMNRNM